MSKHCYDSGTLESFNGSCQEENCCFAYAKTKSVDQPRGNNAADQRLCLLQSEISSL